MLGVIGALLGVGKRAHVEELAFGEPFLHASSRSFGQR